MEDASDDIPDTKVGQWPKWTATGAPTQKGTALRVEKNAWETQRLCINQSAGSRAETTEANKVDGRGRFRTRRRFPNGRGAARSLIQPRSSSINAAAGGKGHRKSFVGAIRFRCRGGPSSWTSRRCSTTGRPKEQPPPRLQATTTIQQRLQEAPLDDFVQNRLRDEEEHFRGMLTMKKMTGDGNCIFHALAEKSGENGVHLRSQIIQYLKENAASQEHEEQVEAWLEEAEHLESNPSNWGGDTAIVAFTLMRQQQAFLHCRASDGEICTSERTHVEVREEARRHPHAVPNVYYHAIHLWFNGKDHYDVLVPIDQT
ncbi:OTUD4, partial [Symbiodinium sp. CCMP2592]